MPLDPYASCPCGSGKKLKFCCSDLIGEMEKVERMLEGGQRAACLEYVKSLRSNQPDRASLLGLQAMLEAQLDRFDDARTTLATFLEKHPENRIALAESAILTARTEGGRAAIVPLQQALDAIDQEMPVRVYEAIGAVGQALLAQGEVFAARPHLLLQANIGGTDDTRAMQFLLRLNSEASIPLLLKDDPLLDECEEDVPWSKPFAEAIERAMRGAWAAAEKKFTALLEPSGQSPKVWRNLALVRGWLADGEGAVEALRKFTTLDVPLDEAVEAEALAQLLDRRVQADSVDIVRLTYPVRNTASLEASLAADSQVNRINVDPAVYAQADEPPPRACYWLLDRPIPETGVGIAANAIPHVVGRMFFFGRQTDREARLEVVTNRNDRFEAVQADLCRLGGDALRPVEDETLVDRTTATAEALGWSWRMPDDTPPEHRKALVAEQRENVILNVWPTLSLPALGGSTPAEAAQDESQQSKVLAAILLMEMSADEGVDQIDFNQLRARLGLPTADPIDPTDIDVARLPLVRLARLQVEKLADDVLVDESRRAAMAGARSAIRSLAGEVVSRPSLDDQVDKAEAYGILAELEPDTDRALALIEKARQSEQAAGRSPARWLLAELAMRIERGDLSEAQQLITEIRTKHFQEEGVAQGLLQILQAAGVVGPDGTPVGPPPEETSGIVVPDGESGASGEIWTPDAERSGKGDKPAIWTPGMD